MKNVVKIFALTVCAASAFALSACSGCGGTTNYKTTTLPNWQIRNSSADELQAGSFLSTNKEVATYSIAWAGGSNSHYSFDYDGENSHYTTTFYVATYNWNSADVPEGMREEATDPVYVYETELVLNGTITMGGETHEFTNTVTTESYFRSAANGLIPVYSRQDIHSTSPNTLQPAAISSAYVEMTGVYETFYSRDGVRAETNYTSETYYPESDSTAEAAGTYSAGIGSEYSAFDASYLAVTLRSLSQSGTHLFDIYAPVNGAAARYQAAWGGSSAVDSTNENYAGILSALNAATDNGYLLMGSDEEGVRTFSWTPVTVSLVASMAGPSNTYYYASVTNYDMNATRSVLMRIEEVVPFSLGTIIYNLSSLTLEPVA